MPIIRAPRQDELEALRSIERDAGQAFAAIGMAEIAGDEPLSVPELEAFRADGRAWVVADCEDRPVAYLLSAIVDGSAHIEQVSVSPAHARQGVGARLIEHLAQQALAEGRPVLTLTTFRDVPWNAPYYRRLGFATVDAADQGPELTALVAHEAASIPGDAPRVAMRRLLKPPSTAETLREIVAEAGRRPGSARRSGGGPGRAALTRSTFGSAQVVRV